MDVEAATEAAEAALAALPPAPAFEPRYPKPRDAAVWLTRALAERPTVELDSTMADVLPTLAHASAELPLDAPHGQS